VLQGTNLYGQQEEFNQHGYLISWKAVFKTTLDMIRLPEESESLCVLSPTEEILDSEWLEFSLSKWTFGFVFPLKNFIVFTLSFYFLFTSWGWKVWCH
jgi:membrane protein insertase Oxa1/YidC/SpoIIIJ